jgi:TPR repeat protein
MKIITISLLSFLLLTSCANSRFQLERGIESYQRQDYRQAFLRLEPVAKAGNPEAQYALAFMYYYGRGTIEDRQAALKWMQTSAQQGNQKAAKALSIIKKSPQSAYKPKEKNLFPNGY